MEKCKYPTSLLVDFDPKLIHEAHAILSLSLPNIYTRLISLLKEDNKMLLLCILRLLLEIPINNSSIVIIGWFINNGFVPPETIFLLIKNLTMNLETAEELGHLVLFSRSILPKLPKYRTICRILLDIPYLQYQDNYLYNVISSSQNYDVQFENIDLKTYYIIPSIPQCYSKINNIQLPQVFPTNAPSINTKSNIFSLIEYASTLPPNQQRLYCLNLCLTYAPPLVLLHSPALLSAACEYTRLLLFDSVNLRWDAFDIHSQLERMGNWICALTIEHGPPPPLYLLNIPLLIRECASTGSLGNCMIFLNALFHRSSKIYIPPNPLTVSILSVLSACYFVDYLRIDIKKQIELFFQIFDADITYFHLRSIYIPMNTFDCSAQFIQVGEQSVFQSSSSCPEFEDETNSVILTDPEVILTYFHYTPNFDMLRQDLKELCINAQRIEKYYFVDGSTNFYRRINIEDEDQHLLQSFVSLALADSPILAKKAAKLFTLTTKNLNSTIDLSSLFRCAFPNKYILSSCLKCNCLAPEEVNVLFSELLTNAQASSIVYPIICSFMPICFEYCPDYPFSSVCALLNIQKAEIKTNKSMRPPDKTHINLLKLFIDYKKNKNDEKIGLEYFKKLSDSSPAQIVSLISFVFNAAKKTRKVTSDTTIDFLTIDNLCVDLGKCANQVYSRNNDKFIHNCILALQSISSEAPLKLLFRLLHGLLSHFPFNSVFDQLIDLFKNFFSPNQLPQFSLCWIQLCMHQNLFPSLVVLKDKKALDFCLYFVCMAISLLIEMPDVFYRGVVRILMTMVINSPYFIVSYYEYFLEILPIRFIQLRNVILSVYDNEQNELPLMLGISFTDELVNNNFLLVLNEIFSYSQSNLSFEKLVNNITNDLEKVVHEKLLNEYFDLDDLTIPKLIWQFVVYSLNQIQSPFHKEMYQEYNFNDSLFHPTFQMFLNLQIVLNLETIHFVYNALIDQLRYPNELTNKASVLIDVMFEKADDVKKEILFVCLLKRLLCVTKPPKSLIALFLHVNTKFGLEMKRIFKGNGEYETYLSAISIVKDLRQC